MPDDFKPEPCCAACVLVKWKGGQSTTGGCHCLDGIHPEQARYIRKCFKWYQVQLEMAKANTITAQALSDELNAEVIEHVKTGIRPASEDKGRTVLVPEKQYRAMREECILAAIRRGPVDCPVVPVEITTNGPEGDSYVIVEEKK